MKMEAVGGRGGKCNVQIRYVGGLTFRASTKLAREFGSKNTCVNAKNFTYRKLFLLQVSKVNNTRGDRSNTSSSLLVAFPVGQSHASLSQACHAEPEAKHLRALRSFAAFRMTSGSFRFDLSGFGVILLWGPHAAPKLSQVNLFSIAYGTLVK